jgi:hypothetical protein
MDWFETPGLASEGGTVRSMKAVAILEEMAVMWKLMLPAAKKRPPSQEARRPKPPEGNPCQPVIEFK